MVAACDGFDFAAGLCDAECAAYGSYLFDDELVCGECASQAQVVGHDGGLAFGRVGQECPALAVEVGVAVVGV